MINIDNFYDYEKKLTDKDLNACEKKLGITIPDSLKQLYLNCNGGMVYKDIWKTTVPPYKLQVFNFIPIKYNKAFKNDPDFIMEGIAFKHWDDKKLPKELLPFARDLSNGFLCININTGAIYQYLRLEWDDTLNTEQNFKKNSIYLSDSLENFLNALTYDEEQNNAETVEDEDIKPRASNKFYDSEQAINTADLNEVEKLLKIKIPVQLRQFLLHHNGGMPENNAWLDPEGEFEWVAIHELIPVKYYKKFNNNKNYLMPFKAADLWGRKLLPETFLPFAIDAGGNYFCIDINNGKIYYYTLDTWSDNLSLTDNQDKSTLFLCNSFNEFISKLVCEDDLDDLYGL
ncbi:MAG: SMI1/KNR4 family protein [Gilliamella sp.]|uniref:SMI1/KNR4 family protein n=1 Tax=Gilliamella sp. TaxID=1891236 RepID=UPI0025F061A6|nr:SMI1/KNR4 family protein [Gilliamella sp.]MCO6536522.1 SMI1/KNR4 family protein [Gilliamella sp.]MCO6554340.1 SMI1/KNR4 family protein [Gilliamella sp.]